MKITYLGQMCYRIETDTISIVTDPYLSSSVDRPPLSVRKYPAPTTLCELLPDVILISHPHGDHLDLESLAPYVKLRRRMAILLPKPAMAKLASVGGNGTPMTPKAPAEWSEPFELAGVKITAIPCAHTELHTVDGDYVELSYLIEADGKKVFFGGDMSMYDGLEDALKAVKPDVMLLPVNGRDWFRTSRNIIGNLDSNEAAELAVRVGTSLFIPGHHDLYDSNGCPNEWIEYSAKKFGAPLRILKPEEFVEI